MSAKLTELVLHPVRERLITSLTGSGITSLDGQTTVGLALSPVPYLQFMIGTEHHLYRLRAGTDAERSPDIIRPNDYATGTNQKVWEKVNISGGSLKVKTLADLNALPSSHRYTICAVLGGSLAFDGYGGFYAWVDGSAPSGYDAPSQDDFVRVVWPDDYNVSAPIGYWRKFI